MIIRIPLLKMARISSEASQKLEEEVRNLRERLHRSFIQESGVEMLCRLEKSELEAEKARNLADFQGKLAEIKEKEQHLQAKRDGLYSIGFL